MQLIFALTLFVVGSARIFNGQADITDFPSLCPQGWSEYFNSDLCIKAFPSKVDYFDAELTCNKQGGHLVSIHNGFQNNQVLAVAETSFTQCRYWIGANRFGDFLKTRSVKTRGERRDADIPWSWLDKTSFTYESWKTGFPDGSSQSPDCAFMDVETGARWANNGSCAEKNCFVCESPQAKASTQPIWTTNPPRTMTTNQPTTATYNPYTLWTTEKWRTTGTPPCPYEWTTTPYPHADNTTGTPYWSWTTGWPMKKMDVESATTTRRTLDPTTSPWWLTTYNPCLWTGKNKVDKTPNTVGTSILKLFGW